MNDLLTGLRLRLIFGLFSWIGLSALWDPLPLGLASWVVPNPSLDLGLDIANPLNDLIGQGLDAVNHVVVADVVVLHVDGHQDGKEERRGESNHQLLAGLSLANHLQDIVLES